MRFVFVSAMSHCPWGGSEELWSQAALRLRDQGHDVAASVPWWPRLSPKVESLAEAGVELFVRQPAPASLCGRVWRKIVRRIGRDQSELQWLQRQRPDLVCVSNGNYREGLNFLEVCAENKLPYVSVCQANAAVFWPCDIDAERLIRVYQQARQAFFVSQRNRSLLETQLGIVLNNAVLVRNPFTVRWDASASWPDESNGWKLACVARLEPPAKGQDILFHVLASDKWRIRPLTVSLFGQGRTEQGLRRLASRLGLERQVRFCGFASKMEELWANHHALVLPSRYEGLPIALVEAMLCGRPAIVTDVAGNTELLEDGISGFVAAAPTVQHLDDAMERAWAWRPRWQEMGFAGRAVAQANFPQDPAATFAQSLVALARSSAGPYALTA
jgi:glycosyltransferase involved in cell wall biosynthesis